MQHEFQTVLKTEGNITLWRHGAIGISRYHLDGVKFKRDYGSEPAPTWAIEQTGHGAIIAGNVYARGIEEAPGHVASARKEYRALSRAWHSFLGFATYHGALAPNSLKRPWDSDEERSRDGMVYLKEADIEAEVQRRVDQQMQKRTCC
jgi:hypothetical protein